MASSQHSVTEFTLSTPKSPFGRKLLPHCNTGLPRYRFHDVVLVATAQTHGHGLLTKRDGVFGAWTKIALASP
jgi:hypothetical protein